MESGAVAGHRCKDSSALFVQMYGLGSSLWTSMNSRTSRSSARGER